MGEAGVFIGRPSVRRCRINIYFSRNVIQVFLIIGRTCPVRSSLLSAVTVLPVPTF